MNKYNVIGIRETETDRQTDRHRERVTETEHYLEHNRRSNTSHQPSSSSIYLGPYDQCFLVDHNLISVPFLGMMSQVILAIYVNEYTGSCSLIKQIHGNCSSRYQSLFLAKGRVLCRSGSCHRVMSQKVHLHTTSIH